jgi:glycosyltransferase domain-containing protein
VKKNSDITILLTIFNRIDYTNKWLDYAELSTFPFKIFISDGGNIKNIKKKLDIKNRKLDITYKKFKYYKNYNYFFEKYYQSVKKIKSKYIFIAEDDDYIFSNSIIKSAKFLDKNKQFSCAKGINCLGELIRNNDKILALSLRCDSNKKYKSISSNSSDIRLIEYYKKKYLTIYNALHRKESLLKTFKILNSRSFFNLLVTELIFCLSVIYNGKVAKINHIDYIKMDNTNFSSSRNFQLMRPFSVISKREEFHVENNLIFKSIKFYNEKLKSIFISLHNQFIERNKVFLIEEEIKNKLITKKIRSLLKCFLIKLKIYYLVKYLYLRVFKSKFFFKKVMVIDKSLTSNIKKDLKIFLGILSFNKKYKF